jgi:hypothetical protein
LHFGQISEDPLTDSSTSGKEAILEKEINMLYQKEE